MPNIYDILNFNFSSNQLFKASQSIIPTSLNNVFNYRIDALNNVTDQIGASAYVINTNYLIPQVFNKFKKCFSEKTEEFELRELKTLVYSLTYSSENQTPIINNIVEVKFAIKILEKKWRDSFLIGLIDCFLRNWGNNNIDTLIYLQEFIAQKLNDYKGNRNSLISFKENKRYFNMNNGDLILGDTLSKLNKSINEVTKFLKVPDTWFQYSYFSNVIISYYVRRREYIEEELEDLEQILQRHNKLITSKIVISKAIIHINKNHSQLQDKIKTVALKIVGDPSHATAWIPPNDCSESTKAEIILAKKILNEWITKQFIDIFFKTCINEPRRREFWRQYSSRITSFKILGSIYTKELLKRNETISDIIESRFQPVISKKNVSAFILYIDNYMLIEFSDKDYAFYAYKLNSIFTPNLSIRLSSVDDLRNGTLKQLIYRTGDTITEKNDEGRQSHHDGDKRWEEVFHYWLKNMAKIDV